MSTTPWRQRALGTRPTLVSLLLSLLASVLVAGVASPVPAGASSADASAATHGHQKVFLQVLPPIVSAGPATMASSAASTLVVVRVTPAQWGRTVVLQTRTSQGWRVLARATTHADGRAQLAVTPRSSPAGSPQPAYRVIARPYRGLPTERSAPVLGTWGAPDFVDEFDGSVLGPAWEHRVQDYNPWGGRACAKGSPAAVAVAGGTVNLSSTLDPATPAPCLALDAQGRPLGVFPYRLNGHISTQQSADFLYGVAAARMRFQRDPGAHSAFWLQPRGLLKFGTTPWGAEIDVVEWYGQTEGQGRLASTVHAPLPTGDKMQIGGAVPRPERFLGSRSDSWWQRYHVFSVEWTPREYVFRIGRHEVWRTSQGVSHTPEFLILSMLTNDFELPQLSGHESKPLTASVDWVAFWQAD